MDNLIQFPRKLKLVVDNDDLAVNLSRLAQVLEYFSKPENEFLFLYMLQDIHDFYADKKTFEDYTIKQHLLCIVAMMEEKYDTTVF